MKVNTQVSSLNHFPFSLCSMLITENTDDGTGPPKRRKVTEKKKSEQKKKREMKNEENTPHTHTHTHFPTHFWPSSSRLTPPSPSPSPSSPCSASGGTYQSRKTTASVFSI